MLYISDRNNGNPTCFPHGQTGTQNVTGNEFTAIIVTCTATMVECMHQLCQILILEILANFIMCLTGYVYMKITLLLYKLGCKDAKQQKFVAMCRLEPVYDKHCFVIEFKR